MKKPKTLGSSIDTLASLRIKRMEQAKKVDALKSQESELHEYILGLLAAQKLDKGSGKLATVSIRKVAVARIKSWPKFVAWCVKNNAEDCVQRRVNPKAYIAHLEEKVRGTAAIDIETIRQLSVTTR